jgi:hypothetical protein
MSLFKKEAPKQYEANGNQIICQMCRNDYFFVQRSQLNTSLATFFNLDWTNKEATCFVCSECRHIHWFLV